MKRVAVLALACLLVRSACAQDPPGRASDEVDPQNDLRDIIEQRIEAVADQMGSDNNVDLTALTEVLTDYIRSPMDLNKAEPQDLAQLQLLSDVQVTAIIEHRQRFGPFISIYELQTIDEMDPRTIALIRPFVQVRADGTRSRASFKEILKNGSHEILSRTIVNVEQRAGFRGQRNPFGVYYTDPDGDALPDTENAHITDSLRRANRLYLGDPFKIYARYRFRYRQNVSFGVTMEKDEGEQFFKGTQPNGFDFYSAHLFLRDVGPVKSLALGDYTAQFGQGLVFWSGLAYGSKSAYTMNIKRNAAGLMPYSSVNENLFLRGVATTVRMGKRLEGTAFFSHKGIDANVTDSDVPLDENIDQEAAFSSLLEDGYHRTYQEVSRKDAVQETILGGHLRYKRPRWSVGGTVAHVAYNHTLDRNLSVYNRFELEGQENTTMGVDWNVMYRNLTWFGEGARSANGGMAGTTGVLVALDKRLSLSMLYRDFGRDYQNAYSRVFAEGSNPWNERGLYTGLEIRPTRAWSINAFMDQFRFPWLRYLTNAPSSGYDVFGQVSWKPDKKTEVYVRARHQAHERNASGVETGTDPLVAQTQTNYRLNASYKVDDQVSLRTRVEHVTYRLGDAPAEHGFLVYEDVVHRPKRFPVEFTGRVALFGTDSYATRLYAYENDIIGTFSIPPYYGKGMRWYAMARWSVMRGVDIWVRYGAWIYNDVTSISSGLQETSGSRKSDVKVEVRVRL
ncbi:MAG TPA: helix-hairpin-helix domain-containing protein [Flavobacteriales bacterium]|nr:helix-hairpin-helix domain-containing protein [Flavobacteriales bacterium]